MVRTGRSESGRGGRTLTVDLSLETTMREIAQSYLMPSPSCLFENRPGMRMSSSYGPTSVWS